MSTQVLSDKNIVETPSQIVARRRSYADLDLRFRVNPNTRDIRPVKDISAIKNSVRNLLLTNKLERPFQPDLGSNLTKLLFEPADPVTVGLIKEDIAITLANNEPRVRVTDIQVEDYSDRNAYFISVTFRVINLNADAEVELYLERVK